MENRSPATRPKYPIESVDNALKLLLMFRELPRIGVTEASERLGVARSTAHRLLAMLQYHGFAQQDPIGRVYRPGPALLRVGLTIVQEMDVRRQARPTLEELAHRFDETAHLVVLQGREILFVDCVESSRALRAGARVGSCLPAHCTAAGKALLAELPEQRLRDLYPSAALDPLTPNSITRRVDLERELAAIRARGYAINTEESEVGLAAVAAAVRDGEGRPVGAVTVAGPAQRFAESRLGQVAAALLSAVGEISARLEHGSHDVD